VRISSPVADERRVSDKGGDVLARSGAIWRGLAGRGEIARETQRRFAPCERDRRRVTSHPRAVVRARSPARALLDRGPVTDWFDPWRT